MVDIHITREYTLGLAGVRKLAFRWAEEAEEHRGLECVYEEGKTSDLVTFRRTGVSGELKVTKDRFDLDARLGVLLGAFKERIETEIVKNLDKLLAQKDPQKAFDKAMRERAVKAADKKAAGRSKA